MNKCSFANEFYFCIINYFSSNSFVTPLCKLVSISFFKFIVDTQSIVEETVLCEACTAIHQLVLIVVAQIVRVRVMSQCQLSLET